MGGGRSVAVALADALRERGVRRLFGVPGSGSSLDLIGAAARVGIDFVLTRTETAAAIMASVTAELTGAPGVVVTGLGPGAAAVANGVAYAALDRAPLVVVTDTHAPAQGFATHQRFDHAALFAPLVKRSCRPSGATTSAAELAALLDEALAPPQGAVHIDLSGPAAAETVAEGGGAEKASRAAGARWDVTAARALLAGAERPVLLVGLQARRAPEAARSLAADLGGPVLTSWKARGVVADDDPLFVGLFAGGELEADCVGRADLIVQFGFDPVELIPQGWRYRAPVVDVGEAPGLPHYARPAASLVGSLAEGAGALMGAARRGGWPAEEVRALREDMARRQAMPASATPGALGPRQVVEAAVETAPAGCRAAVDAGAHMFPVIALWPSREPNAVLISNGLATMGFALPAAIASALAEPERPVVAFTGDGGLLMCLGELATAAERGCRIAVVVFDDAALSLIDANRTRRGLPDSGRSLPPVDFAAAARAVALDGRRATTADELRAALGHALDADGPTLIDVPVDPGGYPALLKALRG